MNVYCSMISSVLAHMKHNEIINYVDDSIVLGETFDKHLENIEKTLKAFTKNGLILRAEKCDLVKEETEFLGHRVTPQGIRPIKRYIDTIQKIKKIQKT